MNPPSKPNRLRWLLKTFETTLPLYFEPAGPTGRCHTGCSKRSSSKAAGEEKPQAYPLGYVEDFSDPENAAGGLFQHPDYPLMRRCMARTNNINAGSGAKRNGTIHMARFFPRTRA